MQKSQTLKLILLNAGIVVLNILVFSKGIGNVSITEGTAFQKALGITIIIMSIIAFIYGNFQLLQTTKRPANVSYTMEELDEPHEFIEVLQQYKKVVVFQDDINMAINQLERLQRKRKTLDEVLFQNYQQDVNEFGNLQRVVDDTANLFYENLKKMIKRMSIFDPQEYIKVNNSQFNSDAFISKRQLYDEHLRYIKMIINQNEAILLEFDNLLVEISKADETGERLYSLDSIKGTISAMKSFRSGKDDLSDLEAKYDEL